MIPAIILLIISVIIQGITSNYLGYIYTDLSLFSTIYVLITILVLNPYFENKKKYVIVLIIFGLIMDIVFTNTVLFNICLFLILYYFNKTFHFFLPYNFVTVNISSLCSVFLYHIITFGFLVLVKYDQYTISMLIKILSHSIIMTITYTSLIYGVCYLLYQKLELRQIK